MVPGPSAVAVTAAPGRRVVAPLGTLRLRDWQALDDAVAGQHAAIHGEVAAHHEGAHGGVLLGQDIRFVRQVRLVFAAVDEHEARVPAVVTVALVRRVYPSSTSAQA